MTTPRRFMFGEDFRGPPPETPAPCPAGEAAPTQEAVREAFETGLAAGRREAEAETSRRATEALERLAAALPDFVARTELSLDAAEADCLHFFEQLARKLAGTALAEKPLAAVADAAVATFRHLRGVPHLAVRVNAAVVEDAEALLKRLARDHGFEGRVIVMGDEDIPHGDVRLDWADGGLIRNRSALDAAVDAALAAAKVAAGRNGTGQEIEP